MLRVRNLHFYQILNTQSMTKKGYKIPIKKDTTLLFILVLCDFNIIPHYFCFSNRFYKYFLMRINFFVADTAIGVETVFVLVVNGVYAKMVAAVAK